MTWNRIGATLCVAMLAGCNLGERLDKAETRLADLEKTTKFSADLNARIGAQEEALRKGVVDLDSKIKTASDQGRDYTRGIEAKLGKDIESVQTQLRPIADDAGESRKTSAEAVGIAQTASDNLKSYQGQVEALHAGYLEAIKKLEESFATRLLGSQQTFEAKVGRLETELKGAEAEVAAATDLRLKQALAEVEKFKTELLGELHKNREEIDKTRLANEGFKAQLADALDRMQTIEKGFLAETRLQVDRMEKTYQGLSKQFDDVKKQVDGYKQQLANVRIALEGALGELKKPGS